MNEFSRALEDNPAPQVLGDVSLRYEPSMLVGETKAGRRTARPVMLAGFGAFLGLSSIASLVRGRSLEVAVAAAAGGAAGLAASVWLSRAERRRRAFVVNFATASLRLDFASRIAGQPRTLVVPFDAVQDVALFEQRDGAHCLTVDFVRQGRLLREVLAAHISPAELDAARRLARILTGAFGLGSIPPDSPFLATQGAGRPVAGRLTPRPDLQSTAGPEEDA